MIWRNYVEVMMINIFACPVGGCESDNSVGIFIAIGVIILIVIAFIIYKIIKKVKK